LKKNKDLAMDKEDKDFLDLVLDKEGREIKDSHLIFKDFRELDKEGKEIKDSHSIFKDFREGIKEELEILILRHLNPSLSNLKDRNRNNLIKCNM
jgi:hypothetical protein